MGPENATMTTKDELVAALKAEDWSNISDSGKALIKAAIEMLDADQIVVESRQSLLPKLKLLIESEIPECIYPAWREGLTEGEQSVWKEVSASKEALISAYEEASILHAFTMVGLDQIVSGLPLATAQ